MVIGHEHLSQATLCEKSKVKSHLLSAGWAVVSPQVYLGSGEPTPAASHNPTFTLFLRLALLVSQGQNRAMPRNKRSQAYRRPCTIRTSVHPLLSSLLAPNRSSKPQISLTSAT
jgi:hypothetical protein